ncbi:MAG: DUF4192 domain-containing protein [Nocardioidaceae bacterium]
MRASSIQDLLGSVPALLGFHPRRSLVAITMQGKRLGFRLRVDLPEPGQVDDAAEQLVVPLLAQCPDGVILVAYIDPEPSGARSVPRMAADGLVSAMRRRLAADGVQVREAIRCDGSRYWSYLCKVAECCPPEGTPYEIESSTMLANAVFNGVEVLADREQLVRRFAPVSGRRRRQMSAITDRVVSGLLADAEIDAADHRSLTDDRHPGHRRLLRAGAAFVQARLCDLDAEAARALSDEDAARLSFWSMLVPVRDLGWSYIEPRNAPEQLTLWTSVAQRAVPPFEPAALCLAAFAAWLSGDGAQARCALDRVRAVDPAYSMGRLLDQTLDGFVSPDAWEPFDRDAIWAMIPDSDDRDCA